MSGAPVVVRPSELIFRDLHLRGFWQKDWLDRAPRDEFVAIYARLAALVSEGALRVPIAATYPLEKYEDALVHATQADRVGKVLFA
jgi:NADPH:quinone reductase-like Zn-dependent oxidoreductase